MHRLMAGTGVALLLSATVAGQAQAAPRRPSGPPSASAACLALGALDTCTTAAVKADPNCGCIVFSISPDLIGWGNVYDVITKRHVGPTNATGFHKITGLTNWYALDVRNTLGISTLGIISGVSY